MVKPKIVAIGEVLWDLLPGGRQLGGAPANFACAARALGANARLISCVGDDDLGREALGRLAALGLPTDSIEVDPERPTGTVGVTVDAGGQPRYEIHEGVAWDAIRGNAAAREAAREADAICFGTLAQRAEPSESTIRTLVSLAPAGALRILDVNLRQHYHSPVVIEQSLALANVLKVNDGELPHLAALFELSGGLADQLRQLADRFRLRLVVCTRGAEGSLIYADGEWSDHPGRPATVVDTVGAGDAFTAAMTLGLLAGWDLDEVNRWANEVAAFVCSQPGATPAFPAELLAPFRAEA